MDGMSNRADVYVIAATNRPDMIDPAMLRPGRLDKCLYVDLPSAEERLEILKTVSRKIPLGQGVDLKAVAEAERCQGFSGADLASLVREAGVSALRTSLVIDRDGIHANNKRAEDIYVEQRHFEMAFERVSPSVSSKDRRRYELLKVKFGNEKM
jgi:ribosome biogenesis ATPase